MFERLTPRARQVVRQAQVDARGLDHDYVGTEHLLVALAEDPNAVSSRALATLGVTAVALRKQIVSTVGRGSKPSPEAIPFKQKTKEVLGAGVQEALSLGHDYIGTEHLLLALVREAPNTATWLLNEANVKPEQVRDAVTEHLAASD